MISGLLYNSEYLDLLHSSLENKIASADGVYLSEQLKLADALLHNRVAYINDWDMEKCTTYYEIPANWSSVPNGDGEWTYGLNRMEYLPALFFAYAIKKDRAYLDCWERLIEEQYQANKKYEFCNAKIRDLVNGILRKTIGQKKFDTNRTLDTAIRICMQSYGLLFAAAYHVKLDSQDKIVQRIRQEICNLSARFRKFDESSNWGAIILSAQIIADCITCESLDDEAEHLDQYAVMLNKVLGNQLSESGVQNESSFMYHTQVNIYVAKALYYLRCMGVSAPAAIEKQCSQMSEFVRYITPESGKQIAFGDSDETPMKSFFWLTDCILGKSFGLADCSGLDLNLCGDICETTICANGASPRSVEHEIGSYCDAGIVQVNRGKWNVWGFHTLHTSGHSHGDMGQVIVHYDGQPLLIDSGRYSYRNCLQRRFLKSAGAHNVLLLENGRDWSFRDAWVCTKKPSDQMIGIASCAEFDAIGMGYCSEPSEKSVHVQRLVAVLEEAVIVVDHVKGTGDMTVAQNYIVDNEWRLQREETGTILETSNEHRKLYFSHQKTWDSQKAEISLEYNALSEGNRVFAQECVKESGYLITVIGANPFSIRQEVESGVCKCSFTNQCTNQSIQMNITFQQNGIKIEHKSVTQLVRMEKLFDES